MVCGAALSKGLRLRLIPVILLSVALIIASLIWVSIPLFFPPTGPGQGGGSVDNQARIDLELMRGDLEIAQETAGQLQDQVDALENRVNLLEAAPTGPAADGGLQIVSPTGPNSISNQYAQVVLVADRRNLNKGLTVPSPTWLTQAFGAPTAALTDDCGPMTNPRLAALLVSEQAGPIPVKMLKPAIESLRVIFQKIQMADPDLYARINTAGSLCVRNIRGATGSASTHSFGLAVDVNIDGVLDTLGDGRTQLGITIMSDFFNADGWVWGAAYGREDSMHFEVSKEKVEQWIAAGQI